MERFFDKILVLWQLSRAAYNPFIQLYSSNTICTMKANKKTKHYLNTFSINISEHFAHLLHDMKRIFLSFAHDPMKTCMWSWSSTFFLNMTVFLLLVN